VLKIASVPFVVLLLFWLSGCGLIDIVQTGGTNQIQRLYGPSMPNTQAHNIWRKQIQCERYKQGIIGGVDPCVEFEEDLSRNMKLCEETKNGTAKYRNDSCEIIDIFEKEFKRKPDYFYPTNLVGADIYHEKRVIAAGGQVVYEFSTYASVKPDSNARELWSWRNRCDKFKREGNERDKDACMIFERDLVRFAKFCEETRSGEANSPHPTACETIDIYEREYNNKPDPRCPCEWAPPE